MFGHGWLAVTLLALFVGAQNPVVSSVESSLTSSIVEERRLGTAFGVLNAVNGVGDLASSIIAGVLWTFASPAAAFGYGAVLCLSAAGLLTLRAPAPAESGSAG
jgi:MFS family permease